MSDMATKDTLKLVDEFLHSIFFLGKINCPPIFPEEIFAADDLFNYFKNNFPVPFTLYSSRLPRRSPFSCVLDMVVHREGQENEEGIMKTLQEVVKELTEIKESTIHVSDGNNKHSLLYLKAQENEDEITKTLQKFVEEFMGKTAHKETQICVCHGKNTVKVDLLEGKESEKEIKTTLQKHVKELMDNTSNDASYSTIDVSHGNSTVKVVHLKGQESEDGIKNILHEHVKELMENTSNNASYSTIYVSHGNCTVSSHQRQTNPLQTLVKELMIKTLPKVLYSTTICVSHGKNTVKVDRLEGKESEEEIRRKLQDLTKESRNGCMDGWYFTTIWISHGNNTHSVVHLKGQENEDIITIKLQELAKELMKNASETSSNFTKICVSYGNNTHSISQLKRQVSENEVKIILNEVVKKLMVKTAHKELRSTEICISHSNNTVSVRHEGVVISLFVIFILSTLVSSQNLPLEGHENDDGLQKHVKELVKNASKKTLDFTICIYRGNNTDSLVYVKAQESEDEIGTKLKKVVKELMGKTAHKELYSTEIHVSHGNNTVSVVPLNKQMSEDEIIQTLQRTIEELTKNEEPYSTISVSHGNNTVSVVQLKEQEDKYNIEKTLQKLVDEAFKKPLYSTITVYNGNSKDSVRHYGVSMSTTAFSPGQIMVGASCLNFWKEDVAHVVMSYYPKTKKELPNETFDVNIQLPDDVRCQAFDITRGKVKSPCCSCSKMFGLGTTDTEFWPCGNCAEAESLSNLLREKHVRERVQRNGNNKESTRVKNHLIRELIKVSFSLDVPFYTEKETLYDTTHQRRITDEPVNTETVCRCVVQ